MPPCLENPRSATELLHRGRLRVLKNAVRNRILIQISNAIISTLFIHNFILIQVKLCNIYAVFSNIIAAHVLKIEMLKLAHPKNVLHEDVNRKTIEIP